jgi:HD superfamily phosphohydrolase
MPGDSVAVKRGSFRFTEVRDVIHGSIELTPWEMAVIDSKAFQRLRNIKQLGFSEFAYPCAVHNRYIHSIGVSHLAGKVFQSIFRNHDFSDIETYQRFLYLVRVSALLHDVGHGPFSHAIESAMPDSSGLKLPAELTKKRTSKQANHEDYTIKIILESSLTPTLEKNYAQFGITPWHIACVMNPSLKEKDDLFVDKGVNFRTILHQIISSEMDVDRMDYLQRDSYFTGASYGKFDADWLISNLGFHVADSNAHLSITGRGVYTFEDFLLSRYHMFLMVYLHYKSVCYEEVMKRYLESSDCSFKVPADVEEYLEIDDSVFYSYLRKDKKNPWAKRILDRRTYKVAIEVHEGAAKQNGKIDALVEKLEKKGVDYFKVSSAGELSKYFRPNLGIDEKIKNTIYVANNDRMNPVSYVPLENFTKLFERYGEARNIMRVFVPEDLNLQ